ncbi:MAG TPA: hypothetical protein VI934_02445 [Candidatus Nanoarchaeia archaeon]|nr:hypothetical protein [Candidatus Nanoarchaeia archaeon]
MNETKITSKHGVIVNSARKIQHTVKLLTSQIKLDVDAVKLVREARADFE